MAAALASIIQSGPVLSSASLDTLIDIYASLVDRLAILQAELDKYKVEDRKGY